jgi:hypothetical protein
VVVASAVGLSVTLWETEAFGFSAEESSRMEPKIGICFWLAAIFVFQQNGVYPNMCHKLIHVLYVTFIAYLTVGMLRATRASTTIQIWKSSWPWCDWGRYCAGQSIFSQKSFGIFDTELEK